MVKQNFVKLYSQGRSFSPTQPWTPEQNEACLLLQNECGLKALEAAEYVRNGIMTVTDYEKAVASKFEPKSLEQVQADAVTAHRAEVAKELNIKETPVEEEPVDETAKEKAPKKKATKKK